MRLTGGVLVGCWLAGAAWSQQIPQPRAAVSVEAGDGRLLVAVLNETRDMFALKHNYAPARSAYETACQVSERIVDAAGEFYCRMGAANCSLDEARYDEALKAYEELRGEAAARSEHAAQARVLHGMGLVERSRSEHSEAAALYEQALAEAALAGDDEQTAQIEMHAGNLYTFLSRYREATSHLERALEISRRQNMTVALRYEHEALRDASLAVMRNPVYRHPFYWAAFALVGDGL
jgi:tetratricopeptide (TPR) repeat protein